MDTIILIAFPFLAITFLALYQWSRQAGPEPPASQIESRTFDGLFAERNAIEAQALARAEAELRAEDEREQSRAALLARACVDDETALDDAHALGDREIYNEVLDALVSQAAGDRERLRGIAEYIVDSRALRSTREFAKSMIPAYDGKLDQRSLADMLYLAALSDDAAVYEEAIRAARERFRQRRIALQPRDFVATVESGYWLIAAGTRYSGAGFTLKQLIAEVRRELTSAVRFSA
ncbi:MAG: hypothetical protein SF339_19330 [Blastocatellia bacterium]|nr:hypothetical protein [Blastocatellia bacterium]